MDGVDDSLRGKLLIASPALIDPNFARSVVLMTEHNEEGAMGIVLNRPADAPARDLLPALEEIAGDDPLFIGGPVQPQAVVLLAEFSDPEAAGWLVVADVGLAAADRRGRAAPSVRRGRFYAGYSGWGPGQLEAEMEGVVDRRPRSRASSSRTTPSPSGTTYWRMGGQYRDLADARTSLN